MNYKRLFFLALSAFIIVSAISFYLVFDGHNMRMELQNSGSITECPEVEIPECPACEICPTDCPQTPIERTLQLKGECIPSWDWKDHPELDKKREEIMGLAAEKYPTIVKGALEANASEHEEYLEEIQELNAIKQRGKELKKIISIPLDDGIQIQKSFQGVSVQIDEDCMPKKSWYDGNKEETTLIEFTNVSDIFAFAEDRIIGKPEDEDETRFSKEATDEQLWKISRDFLQFDFLPQYSYKVRREAIIVLENEHLIRRDAPSLVAAAVELAKNPLIKWFLHRELRDYWKASGRNWSKLHKEAQAGADIHHNYDGKTSFLYRRWWSQRDEQVGNDLIALYRLYLASLAQQTGMKDADLWAQQAKKDVQSSTLRWKKTHLSLLK